MRALAAAIVAALVAGAAQAALPAFPGAEGHGALAVGGRGGRVIEVTNLEDRGPGSLRAALEAEGPRVVVFRVAGTISLGSVIRIERRNSRLTVAGQTAPGGGILLRGGGDESLIRLQRGAHDVILRHLRLRNGTGVADNYGNDNLTVNEARDVVIDHLSLSWATDENLGIWRERGEPLERITVQRCLLAEGLAGHSNGMLISGASDYRDPAHPVEAWKLVRDLTVHHNLWAHNAHRHPRATSAGTQVINNVVYNWKYRTAETSRGSVFDWIHNYTKLGPMRLAELRSHPERIRGLLMRHAAVSEDGKEQFPDPSIHSVGTVIEPGIKSDPAADDWPFWTLLEKPARALPPRYRRATPLPQAPVPVRIESARQAYASVLADVGANARLDCEGRWVRNPDAVDLRLLADVRDGTGPAAPVPSPAAAGGYPEIAPGVACPDADHDAMPDAWESQRGFDPRDPADGPRDADGDGYTNVEEYLNGPAETPVGLPRAAP